MNNILDQLQSGRLLLDGGMGSLLQEKGLPAGTLPETWNLTQPEIVTEIHASYLAAGSDIVTANTFGANRLKYPEDGTPDTETVVSAGIACAKEAVRRAGRGAVALDLGPTGKLLKPMGELEFETCVEIFAQVVRAGAAAGADCVLIETMSDLYELKAAVLAAKETCDLPVLATVAFDASGKLLTGGTPRAVVALLEGLRVDALGLNCGLGPKEMAPFAKTLLRYASVPVIVQPNAGLPRAEGGRTFYDVGPALFAEEMKEILEAGASIVGGCCGTTPDHIRALADLVRTAPPVTIEPKRDTLICGFADAVEIGDDPVIIGERINPTGKKRLQQALKENDLEYLLQVGLAQQTQGAHALDVNVGLPEIDEPAMMTAVVQALQGVTELPLQLDTSDGRALSKALRLYNGKALINSVNGKREVMDTVFPLAAKYGGVIVALCLDENGIPETAEGRVAIAKRIRDEAARYGIAQKDLLFDTLCMTISTEERGAVTTWQALRMIRKELGGKTVLGVSNISFGLPHREIINGAFYTMALQEGLSAAIINPGSEAMMRAFHAFRALRGLDTHCASYIEAYRDLPAESAKPAVAMPGKDTGVIANAQGAGEADTREGSLTAAVKQGLRTQAAEAAKALLAERTPLQVIDGVLMPALEEVGRGFENGTLFLPQLLMSAEAAKEAFEVIKARILSQGGTGEKKGKVVIATVRGDIHDIGKNIVKVLLENYNFDVTDLGRDVAPEAVLEAVRREGATLVGLSALMTTTVPAMEETIALLRREAPGVKVMVGGAVMTAAYAEAIGADAYAKDAMGAVHYAEEVLCGQP